MACTACEEFITTFGLVPNDYALIEDEVFSAQLKNHPHFISYSDFSNGVSEGGYGLMCTECKTFVDVHYDMYSESLTIFLKETVDLDDIQNAARMWTLQQHAHTLKESLQQNGRQRFYLISDMQVPHSFRDESSFKPLEIHQRFGLNHPTYTNFVHLHPTLEEAIQKCGTNDRFTETTFILATELDGEAVSVYARPNPYGDSMITINTQRPVPPEQLIYFDLLTGEETPLPLVSLSECERRDNAAYLAHVRMLQKKLPKMENPAFNRSVEEATERIKNAVQIAD